MTLYPWLIYKKKMYFLKSYESFQKRKHAYYVLGLSKIINKRKRIPKGHSKTENPEKLSTRRRKTKQKHNTICVGHNVTQTNTNNVKKIYFFLFSADTTENTDGKKPENEKVEQKSEEERSISNISIDNKNVATNGDTTQKTTQEQGDNQRTAKSRDSDDSSSSSSDEEDKDPDKLRY